MELGPLVEGDAIGEPAPAGLNAVVARVSQVVRPAPPCGPALLGDRAECGEVAQGLSLLADPRGEAAWLASDLKDRFERLRLELEDPVVVDEPLLIQRDRFRAQGRELVCDFLSAFDFLDPQVKHIAKASG